MKWVSGLAGALLVSAVAQAAPVLSFGDDRVTVSQASKNGQVVLFSVAHEEGGYIATLRRRDTVLDTDAGGVATYELGGKVPWRSIWVAIDLATGEGEAATPGEYPLRVIELPRERGLKPVLAGLVHGFEASRAWIEGLFVRPEAGPGLGPALAYRFTLGDGGASDEDGAYDGVGRLSLDRLEPLTQNVADAPKRFLPGDLLVLIDPDRMEYVTLQLGPEVTAP